MNGWEGDRARILVVDDYDGARDVLAEILGRQGFSVQSAPDGNRAWAMLAMDPLFDLVITDLNMPLIDGLELLRKIRERSLPVKVILLTSSPERQVVARARELGAFAVVAKPFELGELMRTVQRAVPKRGPRENRRPRRSSSCGT